ncbi:MAG: hypothetical protein G01um101425_346 [Candidatus Peregrinibacteria bacterium Gr01-1014_25]|nr:MAG: hypothetical protein G01um101425_346 [Candidatus Peregrinibacteria bacterium Gr01-1014_25]
MTSTAPQENVPPIKSHAELDHYMLEKYGEEKFALIKESVKNQKTAMQNSKLNPEAVRFYTTHLQELDRKGEVHKKWYQKLWGGVKETVKAPFRAVGWAFRKHPILTTLGLTILAIVGGAYMTGNLEALLSRIGVAHLDAASKAAAPGGAIMGGTTNPEFLVPPIDKAPL